MIITISFSKNKFLVCNLRYVHIVYRRYSFSLKDQKEKTSTEGTSNEFNRVDFTSWISPRPDIMRLRNN